MPCICKCTEFSAINFTISKNKSLVLSSTCRENNRGLNLFISFIRKLKIAVLRWYACPLPSSITFPLHVWCNNDWLRQHLQFCYPSLSPACGSPICPRSSMTHIHSHRCPLLPFVACRCPQLYPRLPLIASRRPPSLPSFMNIILIVTTYLPLASLLLPVAFSHSHLLSPLSFREYHASALSFFAINKCHWQPYIAVVNLPCCYALVVVSFP